VSSYAPSELESPNEHPHKTLVLNMDTSDVFEYIPITIDPATKKLTKTRSSPNHALDKELESLNTMHRQMVGLETPNSIPGPPVPVNPARSQQLQKLRETGNTAFRKGSHQEAIRMYTLGIGMAKTRPGWEPAGLVREEIAALYVNRAQAYMSMKEWADGLVDARASVEMRAVNNTKGWWRRAKCLLEMGRLDEAAEVVNAGLEFGADADLVSLKKEVDAAVEKKAASL
jgi:translocation protein SEC72